MIATPKAGTNISDYAYFGTTLPFNDAAHMPANWTSGWAIWQLSPDTRVIELTDRGYPARLEANQVATCNGPVFGFNGGIHPLGVYTLTWDGDGDVGIRNLTPASQGLNAKSYGITAPVGAGLSIQITRTNPRNPVGNIRLLSPPGFGDAAGFNKVWTDNLKMHGVIRHLGWTQVNYTKSGIWKDRSRPEDCFWPTGVPYEYMIDLSNYLRSDLWLTVPHQADDNYLTELAKLVDSRLSHGLRCWVEYSNEVWNGGFAQGRYAIQVLCPKYGVANSSVAYGMRAKEVFDIFSKVMRKPRLVRVLAGQAANFGTLMNAATGCGTNFDCMAMATYFDCTPDWLYAQYLANTVNLDEVFAKFNTDITGNILSQINHCADVAVANGVPLVGYEGACGLCARPGTQGNTVGFVDLISAIHRDPRMLATYKLWLDTWYTRGKTMVMSCDIFKPNKWGAWGLQESYLDDQAPKFKAVKEYLA